jgi:hypothetical protein
MRINNIFNPIFKDLNIQVVGKWLFYSIIIGSVGGFGAVIFRTCWETVPDSSLDI